MISIAEKKLTRILEGMRNKKILVVGDLMLDKYLRGRVSRLSPEAPVPIVEIESESYHFGGAANVALNLQALGCAPLLVGLVGNDEYGQRFTGLIRQAGLDDSGVIYTSDRPTTVKTRIIGDNQHIARVDRERILYVNGELEQQILKRIEKLIPQAQAVILEDYNKGVLSPTVIHFALKKAKEHGILSAVDPKFINFMEYKQATIFKPNLKETAQALAKSIDGESEVIAAGQELLARLQADCVLLTRGGQGLSLFEKSGEINHVAARTQAVADVSGAGDTVIATMTAAVVGGADLKEAATMANYAAGLVCQQVGIVPVEPVELKQVILKG